jgi:hypothetical protein
MELSVPLARTDSTTEHSGASADAVYGEDMCSAEVRRPLKDECRRVADACSESWHRSRHHSFTAKAAAVAATACTLVEGLPFLNYSLHQGANRNFITHSTSDLRWFSFHDVSFSLSETLA